MTAPTRYEDFTEPGARPWLDLPGAEAEIARRVEAGELSPERGEMLRNWREQGWLVLDIQLEDELLDPHRLEMDALVDRHRSEPVDTWKVKLQNMYVDSEAARTLMREPRLLEWVDLILGRRCQPYQTLSLPVGSQIGPHSDQILMTTYPEGHMVAAWIALEDIEPDSGPLMLWTGSHKLPYLSAQVVGLPEGGSEGERAVAYDRLYYEACRARIAEHRFEQIGRAHV